jgi:hypothetical protein
MNCFRLVAGSGILALVIGKVSAQSVYVDMDIFIGGEELGAGAPSSAFGGAAGTPGYWNQVQAGSAGEAVFLKDIDNNSTPVAISWTGGAGASVTIMVQILAIWPCYSTMPNTLARVA